MARSIKLTHRLIKLPSYISAASSPTPNTTFIFERKLKLKCIATMCFSLHTHILVVQNWFIYNIALYLRHVLDVHSHVGWQLPPLKCTELFAHQCTSISICLFFICVCVCVSANSIIEMNCNKHLLMLTAWLEWRTCSEQILVKVLSVGYSNKNSIVSAAKLQFIINI